jgi:hypothetical protein
MNTRAEKQSPLGSALSSLTESTVGGNNHPKKDPFDEAQRKEPDIMAGDSREQDSDPKLKAEASDAPTKAVKPAKPLKFDQQQKVKKVGGKRASLALLIALGAAGYLGYSEYQDRLAAADDGSEIASINDAIARLNGNLDDKAVELATLSERVTDAESAITSISDIENQQKQAATQLADFGNEVQGLTARVDKIASVNAATLDEIAKVRSEVASATSRVSQLASTRATPSSQKPVTRRAPPAPAKPIIQTSISGYTIHTLDTWGAVKYLILRDANTGEYTSLREGRSVDGWRFLSANQGKALFENGGAEKLVQIGG